MAPAANIIVRDLEAGDYHKGEDGCKAGVGSKAENRQRQHTFPPLSGGHIGLTPLLPAGYLDLLSQLTTVGAYSEEVFKGELCCSCVAAAEAACGAELPVPACPCLTKVEHLSTSDAML